MQPLPAPDVPIFAGAGFLAEPRWDIADGLVPRSVGTPQAYRAEVWLPRAFRAPSEADVARFVTTTAPAIATALVGVLPVDREATAALLDYVRRARRGDLDEVAGQSALKRLLIEVSRHLVIEGNVETRQPTEERPRQVTVSRENDDDLRSPRVGMHVDHRTTTPLSERMSAPNRLCVNLGPGDRWLLYIPHSVGQLLAHTAELAGGDHRAALAAVAEVVPVLRVRTAPGEAYLAPAEAIFHDASTLDATAPAIKLPLLGRFRPRRP